MTRTGICRFHFVEPRQSVATSLLARKERSDGIAKNERQLCVHHHSRTGTAKKTGLNPVFLLVTLNQPKSNLSAGNSDTLKREPSESVVAIAPRANRRILHHSRTGASKNAHHSRCAFCW